MPKLLELFSGTHSIGKIAEQRGYEVVSLDRDLPATIKIDIMKWDYKKDYPVGYFDIITASPVCLWWSNLRKCWIGRKIKAHGDTIITKEILEEDIENFGKPMVDKVREILEYFKPKYYWIENPQTGLMKNYITDLPFHDVDYCQYSDWGYKKKTRFWTNIKINPKTCDIKNCSNVEEGRHKKNLATVRVIDELGNKILVNTKALRLKHKKLLISSKNKTQGTSKHDRYRIPPNLIEDLLDGCIM